jgi:hypothetical protein
MLYRNKAQALFYFTIMCFWSCNVLLLLIVLFFCQLSIVILLFYLCVVLLVGAYSSLKLFFAYLKQFKFHFNYPFQHQIYSLVIQNNSSRLFQTISLQLTTVHSTQILFHLIKTKFVVKIQLDYQKAKHNKYKIKFMFLHQIHISIFI